MPYIYNSSALLSASVSDNLQPITLPPVGRYMQPWGLSLQGVDATGNQARHVGIKSIQFVPIKPASTVTLDRIGMTFTGANGCVDTWTYTLGLYTNNATDNYPNTLITTFGTLTYQPGVTADGPQEITINQTLNANTTYWLAVGVNYSATTDFAAGRTPWSYQIQGDYAMFRKRGTSSVFSGGPGMAWLHSAGSFSGTLPASVSYATNSGPISVALLTRLRRSA
jgi:hypothetical protein